MEDKGSETLLRDPITARKKRIERGERGMMQDRVVTRQQNSSALQRTYLKVFALHYAQTLQLWHLERRRHLRTSKPLPAHPNRLLTAWSLITGALHVHKRREQRAYRRQDHRVLWSTPAFAQRDPVRQPRHNVGIRRVLFRAKASLALTKSNLLL